MDIDAFIRSKIPGYLIKREEDVKKLYAFFNDNNWAEIQMIGHQLKGNGPTFGFSEIGILGEDLETAATQKDADRILKLIKKLEAFLETKKPD